MNHSIRWQDDLKTGNDIIDSQHKILFDLANDLHISVLKGANAKTIDALFSVLMSYALDHFALEEKLLEGDDSRLQHCYEHYQLIKQLHDYIHDYRNNKTPSIAPGIFVEQWLINHIASCDLTFFTSQRTDKLTMEKDSDLHVLYGLEPDQSDNRAHKRLPSGALTDETIIAACYNASKLKNCSVVVKDISQGGMKISSTVTHDIDNLLIVSCSIGASFKMKEKLRVINIHDDLYGLKFISLAPETKRFITQLYGSIYLHTAPAR